MVTIVCESNYDLISCLIDDNIKNNLHSDETFPRFHIQCFIVLNVDSSIPISEITILWHYRKLIIVIRKYYAANFMAAAARSLLCCCLTWSSVSPNIKAYTHSGAFRNLKAGGRGIFKVYIFNNVQTLA